MNDPAHLKPKHADQRVVLLAEDEVVVRNIVQIALEEAGYFVLAAGDGQEALSVSRVFSGTIHLLLSDFTMPKMNGLELTQRVLAERPNTPVLLMSGHPPLQSQIPVLPKPFTADVLLMRVLELIQ